MPSQNRILIVALLLFIGVTGPFALADSVHLGADMKPVKLTAKELAARAAVVRASQRSIRNALSAHVPPLPETPTFAPLGEPRVGPVVVFRVMPPSPTRKAPAKPAKRTTKKKVAPVNTPVPVPAPAASAPTTPAPSHAKQPRCEVHDDGSVECQAPEVRGPGA